MRLTFRWFGVDDPIPLAHIRQIPGVTGVVSALYGSPVGEAWPSDALERLACEIDSAGLELSVVESIPVHEDIKLGRPSRDRFIEHYCRSIENVGEVGVATVCYNFMPIFDWTRTSVAMPLDDGSTTLAYDHGALDDHGFARAAGELPGWATGYDESELAVLLAAYRELDPEQLWENLAYFLERVVPVAERAGVKLAVHPDDPPWPIFGLPRILTDGDSLERLVELVDSSANGVTLCTGSLGAAPGNDVPGIARRLGACGRIHFAHLRNVRITGDRQFHECPHPSAFGSVKLREVLAALRDTGFDGPMRPDHGRMIWNENGRPGYGLYDRALGAMYLQGLWEGLSDVRHG
ncbi:MAG TPA: mannonate dehydratase [Gemmatimonadaceae bacterium]|nr:mannonate dehydratase [Gemmatimonadaceae bacterium]